MKARGRKRAAALAIGVIAAGAGTVSYLTDSFDDTEDDSLDARFGLRADFAADDVAFVAIDDVSFSKLGVQWPFPRSLHARVIDRLSADGAASIAYDVQFTEPSTPREDEALIRATRRAGNVVLSTTEVDRRGRTNVFGGGPELRFSRGRPANTVIVPDTGGVWRRFRYRIQGLDGFAVASAEVATGEQVDPTDFDADGAWIDYAGPPGAVPTYSFSDVLRGNVDSAAFEDKVVVVGASAPTLQDVHPTSIGGGLMPGGEVQANAIQSVIDGIPLRSTSRGASIALIIALAFLAPICALRLRPPVTLVIALLAAGGYLVVAQVAFNAGWVLPVVYPLLALLIGSVGVLGMHYLVAAFERQRIRDTFSRFVPANVVDQLLEQGEGELRLGGNRRECTLLFSDIRGFTTYAETTPPDEVVEVLNHYLGEMTDAIMDNGGTLVSYMGDGIMAVFGAPLDQPDHADRAIAAAREMLDVRLVEFNSWMRDSGHGEGFRMGIGLNTGEVMAGQVGSQRRMEYTTIGDTTNTAARLEGMTKGTEHQLFISDTTRAALQRPVEDLVLVGELPVRGRAGEIRVWSLRPPEAETADDPAPADRVVA